MFLKLERHGTKDCVLHGLRWNKLDLIFEEDRRIKLVMKKIIALSAVLVMGALGMACGEAATNANANANKTVANALNAAANAANAVSNAANTVSNAMKPATNAPATNANANVKKP